MAGIGGSYVQATLPAKRRLVVAVDGREKGGKTHFALTAPGPIAYQNWDIGDEGVVEKFQTTKLVYKAEYGIAVEAGDTQDSIMAKALPEWGRCVSDYHLAMQRVEEGAVRTIVKDTSSEEWEALRLARFGKLTQVMPHHYTAVNKEYRNLIREIYETSGNMVLLHKLKAEWKDNPATGKGNKTGGWERAGYADTGFLVQVNVLCWREEVEGDKSGFPTGPFHVTVRDCRQNPGIAGLDLYGDMASFPWLAVHVYPETSLSDWGAE